MALEWVLSRHPDPGDDHEPWRSLRTRGGMLVHDFNLPAYRRHRRGDDAMTEPASLLVSPRADA